MTLDTKVIAIWAGQDKKSKVDKQGEYFFAVDQTPIYAESEVGLEIEEFLKVKTVRQHQRLSKTRKSLFTSD